MARSKQASTAVTLDTMSARDFFHKLLEESSGRSLSSITKESAEAAGISHGTLYRHVKYGTRVAPETAEKLASWSGGKISSAKTLGVT